VKTNTSMTLYNKSVVNGAEVWTRSVVPAVHWEYTKAANVIESGNLQADRIAVYIPDMNVTVNVGDVIVKGTVTKAITSQYTMTSLRTEYDVAMVRSVDRMEFGSRKMRHVQLGAN